MRYLLLMCCSIGFLVLQAQHSAELYVLRYAELKDPSPVSNWVKNASDKDSVPISFHFWLIKSGNQRIMVDAGCRIDLSNAIDFGLTNFERPDSVLLRLGIHPSEITDIIISHPHWDHIDGLPLFPEAKVWMQRNDYQFYVGEAWQKGKKPGGIAPRTIAYLLQLNMSGKLHLVDGDGKEIIDGVKVFTGSRHTFDSQHVVVRSGKNSAVIAGDDIWIYDNLEKMQPPPDFATMNAKGYISNMQRMKATATGVNYILPGHDARLFDRFPKINGRVVRVF